MTTIGPGTSRACGLRQRRAGASTCCASAIGSRAIGAPAGSRGTEIEQSFTDGWRIEAIEPVVFETNLDPGEVLAWQSEISRIS